ncbi:PIG-L family deacetylase [uncultured Clostridium sp.]|uniref:PIG-L family deacetylase n=1 Tax=uncultured Clostridium sp. TaxID=59620 RepID=UPI0025D88CC6|nr:PIG-L family deacetylase [uncultured Clostridium sp.]
MNILDSNKVLIFSPHPDDEVLGCSSIIKWASDKKIKKNIVFLTNGEKDFLGALAVRAYDNLEKVENLYIGCSSLILKVENTLKKKIFIYLFDKDKNPLKDIEVEITNEKNKCLKRTNELGWLLLDASIINFSPKIMVKAENEIVYDKIISINNEFLHDYGERRIRESYSALENLGVKKDEIITLGYGDGTISNLSNSKKDALKAEIITLLRDYEGGTVIIPHVQDVDMDHSSFAKIFKSISDGMNIHIYMYMIHGNENHKIWPKPIYKNLINNRINLEAYMDIIEDNRSKEHVFLEEVRMTSREKLKLIRNYKTQCEVDEYGFLSGFAKVNEVFYKED